MSLLQLAGPIGAVAAQLQVARVIAGVAFLGLLIALGLGLLRTRKQVLHDEVDAALEADFLRLERELLARERAALPPAEPGR